MPGPADGKLKRVVAYASRALNKAEKNYSAYKLEFLALKWAVTEKFSDYLALKHFTVLTDNNPLTYVLTSAKLDATGQRWASALGEYDFDIQYRSGMNNTDADAMSRYPHERFQESDETRVEVKNDIVRAICSNIDRVPVIETISSSINIVEITEDLGEPMAQIEMREIRRQQRQDKMIDRWRIAVIDKRVPTRNMSKEDFIMKRQFNHFVMKRGILYRKVRHEEDFIEQLVLPKCYREDVLRGLHNEVGHPGRDRTLNLLRERFFWPGMAKDAEEWVENCDRCVRRKCGGDIRAPLINVHTSYPLELVCMDFLTLEPSKGGISNILVVTDHFTKFAMAIPTRNQTAKTTAEAFYNNFILHYGIPTRIHSDQGANFESSIIKELCSLTNMEKSRTSIYHPQGNAGPERFNRTLLGMLGTLQNDQKTDWKRYVNPLVYAYNCTPQSSTKHSPFEIMFGRKPKLPIDTMFEQVTENPSRTTKEYIEDLQERMDTTRKIVSKHLDAAKERQKECYDRKAKAASFENGDRVLVKVLAFEGKHKIQDRFEEDIYRVVEQPNEKIPVYRVKSERTELVKTLHRNHLFPIGDRKMIQPVPRKRRSLEKRFDDNTRDKTDETDERCDKKGFETRREDESSDGSDDDGDDVGHGFVKDTNHHGDAHESKDEKSDRSNEDRLSEDDTDGQDSSQSNQEKEEEVEEAAEDDCERRVNEHKESHTRPTEDQNLRLERPNSDDHEDRRNDEREMPTPVPRRSQREKRAPKWFDSYHVNKMTHQMRPHDSRLEALNVLTSSGILDCIDRDVAYRLLDSIIK